MPILRTKQELANLARSFAVMSNLVWHQGHLYMPVHFQTKLPDQSTMNKDNTIWVVLDKERLRGVCNLTLNILFASPAEEASFKHMVIQLSQKVKHSRHILVRVGDHLEVMDSKGQMSPATGDFVANYMDVPYDPDSPLVDELWAIIVEWLGDEEQAHSLLYHVATALQSSWSAVKYVLLIGAGRNGKSTLLKMIMALFGEDNISGVTRQKMSTLSPIMTTLNGKLLNVILDGPKEFLKDSSTEKTLIAGERLMIELKYENDPVLIQTNALFIEGLQQEPQVSDKSKALQARMVRFYFPNTYALDLKFEEKMLHESMLAAFLTLLMRHWVNKDEVSTKLALTAESLDLQLQAVWTNSPLLRFLEHTSGRDRTFLERIQEGTMFVDIFLPAYRDWLSSNGYKALEDDYLLHQMRDSFALDRKTFRIERDGKKLPTTKRYIKSMMPDTANAIQQLLSGHTLSDVEADILEG